MRDGKKFIKGRLGSKLKDRNRPKQAFIYGGTRFQGIQGRFKEQN